MIGVPDLAYGPENAKEMSSWTKARGYFLHVVTGWLQIPVQDLLQSIGLQILCHAFYLETGIYI